ncbi:glycosyltransferase [Aeromonas dhakensis]|uniref:glycosyltransferase n=1 Tax=Aeromonas dhakensis TaxID=196024 RepID=UPI00227D437A|nr:glycosyltransferase [Aeromonas dhakensis]WAG10983.1 glycosyltransferase [Aeromonas dhakensis]
MKNIIILFKFLLMALNSKKSDASVIRNVHTITFRLFSPEGGRGGGAAVQTCQNILLGNRYKKLQLKYSYFKDNIYTTGFPYHLSDLWLWGGALFAIETTKDEDGCVYITHDYGTGFGLAILKKRFVYVAHLQGPRVEEKENYNESMNMLDRLIIKFCERYVFKKALYVCFPSAGACDYYFNSNHRAIARSSACIGPVLYNTLYAHPVSQSVPSINLDPSVTTILSIGALTNAKGIDQIPYFFEKNLNKIEGRVRWIVIGQGPQYSTINEHAKLIKRNNPNFDFIIIKSLSYPEICYLSNLCDVYLMLHRISIFDLATLEAMEKGKCVVLSRVGGNVEFNKNDNIIFDDQFSELDVFNNNIIVDKGERNRVVYNEYFSNQEFIDTYHSVIDDLCN